MAQLPPKVPTQNWPFQKSPASMWADEFQDYSSARRGAHRRSASDSVAFLEALPLQGLQECRRAAAATGGNRNMNINNGGYSFEKLDDDQLMSMFSDDVSVPVTPSSASSDQNSNNNDRRASPAEGLPKPEPGEVESDLECSLPSPDTSGDAVITDPKRVKRILANRQSAQRSRVRKLQYISELERTVSSLQTEVSTMSPRVAFLDHQRLILNVDNSALKQRIAVLAQDKIFKDAHQEALKKEIERLRQVYQQQGLKNNNNNNQSCNNNNGANESMVCTDTEQLLIN